MNEIIESLIWRKGKGERSSEVGKHIQQNDEA